MKGRAPTREERAWMQQVAELGCCVCLNEGKRTPCQVHHIDGKTKPGAHLKTIGLCYYHHQAGNDCLAYTSRHPYKARFVARYGTEQELLEQTILRAKREQQRRRGNSCSTK